MLAFLNLGAWEMALIIVVAILIFGKRLPEVAGQAAATAARLRRQFQDLRRETGIDREIWEARREFERAVPRDLGSLPRLAKGELEKAVNEVDEEPAEGPPAPAAGSEPEGETPAEAPDAPPPTRTPGAEAGGREEPPPQR
jgi:Sec-independent protein translocase protein TatA